MAIPEVLVLVAAWFYVPFGLGRIPAGASDASVRRVVRWLWVPGVVGATAGMCLPVGPWAAAGAGLWLVFAGLLALSGLLRLRERWRTLAMPGWLRTGALLQLPIGAGWLVLSRAGLEPLGFKEPIVVLTAVHFHYAGFLAPVLAAEAIEHLGLGRAARSGGLLLLVGPAVLAAGFVLSPALQAGAALVIVLGLGLIAAASLLGLRAAPRRLPLALSWLCVLAGMALAAVYAIGEVTELWWLNMAEMALTHGLLNGLGFGLLGVWAWQGTPRGSVP